MELSKFKYRLTNRVKDSRYVIHHYPDEANTDTVIVSVLAIGAKITQNTSKHTPYIKAAKLYTANLLEDTITDATKLVYTDVSISKIGRISKINDFTIGILESLEFSNISESFTYPTPVDYPIEYPKDSINSSHTVIVNNTVIHTRLPTINNLVPNELVLNFAGHVYDDLNKLFIAKVILQDNGLINVSIYSDLRNSPIIFKTYKSYNILSCISDAVNQIEYPS